MVVSSELGDGKPKRGCWLSGLLILLSGPSSPGSSLSSDLCCQQPCARRMSDFGLACDLRMVTEQTWLPLAQPDTLHEALADLRGGKCLSR